MAKWLVTDTKSDWMTCWLTFPWRAEWPTKKMTCFCFKLVLEWQHERLMAWLNDFTIDCLYDVLSYFFSEFLLSAQSFLRTSELKPSLSLYLKLPLLWDTSLVSFVLPEPTPLSAPSSPKYLKLFLTPWLSISPFSRRFFSEGGKPLVSVNNLLLSQIFPAAATDPAFGTAAECWRFWVLVIWGTTATNNSSETIAGSTRLLHHIR